ncbi:MAG: class I SAM-dependent methyltransferase [Proteobacteria bacterium]|nr:class I SAM-dependent methyltransferase [Pseudomonadota bacterium]
MKRVLNALRSSLAQSPVAMYVELPGGVRLGDANAPVRLHFRDRMAVLALAMGEVGSVGTAIVEGRVVVEGSMRQVMAAAAAMLHADPARDEQVRWWRRVVLRARSMAEHTQLRDAQHIEQHYDLSDDFYALWLDPRRVYSCAYYREAGMTLAQAQEAKLDHICRKLMLKSGERFLDIGAGWGGLLLWAAEHYGVDATGITLSHHQHTYVQRLIAERGLQGRVRMQLLDYRALQVDEPFDKIASVGMFEHVGHAHMGQYFAAIHRLLRPGGLLMNHGITAGGLDNAAGLGAGMGDFIERYIFPGGELMHVSRALQELASGGLEMLDVENLRPHYARTLWAWSDALEARLDEARQVLVSQHGQEQGEKALLAYRLYLAGCALAFEHGWIALHQILAARPSGVADGGALKGAQCDYPFNRAYMYRA